MARLPDPFSRRVDGDVGTRPLKRTAFVVAVVLCTIAGLAPRLWIALHHYIEYDGWWHIFISRHPLWMPFLSEVMTTAHPPLFFMTLRLAQEIFGYTRFAYRFVPVIASVATVPLLAIIVRLLGGTKTAAVIAALVFALSESATLVATEVRSYALALLFVMTAFVFFCDLVAGRSTRWTIVCLAVANGLAIATHYFSFIFVAVEVAALAVAMTRSEVRKRVAAAMTPVAAVTTAIVAGCAAALYMIQVRHVGQLNHLPLVYFDPNETPAAFLSRNVVSFVNCFSPIEIHAASAAYSIVVISAIVLITALRHRETALPAAFSLLIFLSFVAGGFGDLYPFGGDLRQQFFIFPFLVLACVTVVDIIPARARFVALALIAMAVVIHGVLWMRSFPMHPEELAADEYRKFAAEFGSDRVVAVDQFSCIVFFIHTNDRPWKLLSHSVDRLYDYAVGSNLRVIRDRKTWNYDPLSPSAFVRLHRAGDVARTSTLTLFAMRQAPPMSHTGEEERIRAAAAAARCDVKNIVIDANVFARVELKTAEAPRPAN